MPRKLIAALTFVIAVPLTAQQYGSEYRKEYEKEPNGPHGECRSDWQHIATGIDYRPITCLGDADDLDVHVFRIAPEFWTFDVADVTDGSSAWRQAEVRDAGFVINANFFERDRTPIGVIVRSGTQLQSPHKSPWQAIFLIDDDGEPHIISVGQWSSYRDRAQMAVQAGPRLVVKGHTNKIGKGYKAARAGVCIQKDGDLVFFATPQDRKFDQWEIGRVARRAEIDGGLSCRESMLFDGGHSTQVYAAGDTKTISVEGDPVPVFVFAKRK